MLCFRTKWKRQTAVGLELLAEAGNYAAVQRMLQSNPYWFTYHPQATSIISNFDALYYRQGESSLTSPRPTLPRMFIHGLQQHVNHLSPPSVFSPENRSWFQSFPKTNFQPELRNILNVPLVQQVHRQEGASQDF
jgi:hypothetical protein